MLRQSQSQGDKLPEFMRGEELLLSNIKLILLS